MGYRINGGPLWQLLKVHADCCDENNKPRTRFNGAKKGWGRAYEYGRDKEGGVLTAFCDADKTGETSSLHYHRHADNHFIMLTGCIAVAVLQDGVGDVEQDVQFLTAGDVFCVPKGQRHKFSVVEPSTFVEVYLAQPGSPLGEDDIYRL
jgi:mannose-6-phosphate isomerase-like protein (cupin superfamily)